MAYDRTTAGSGPATWGNDGATISLGGGDYTVPSTVKAIEVVATGNIVLRPLNASADITITGAPVGYKPPWHCLAIRQTGTTATLATVIG